MKGRDIIISLLSKNSSLLQTDLVKLSGMSKSRVSEILSELEKEGIISRKVIAGKSLEVFLKSKVIKIGIIKAAEYPFIIPFYKKLKDIGYSPNIIIYNNGIDVTRDLALGKIDIGFSPVISQIIFSKVFDIKIIAGGAKGGAGIVGESCEIGSTVLSSMETWTMADFKDARIVPFNSPEDLISNFQEKKIKSIAIWEPYLSILKDQGNKISHVFEPVHCCTMAIKSSLDEEKIKNLYESSFSQFLESKDRWIPEYANLIGEDYVVMSKAINNYEFDSYLDLNEVYKYLKKSNIYLP
jgi:predicted transcriptional regulator